MSSEPYCPEIDNATESEDSDYNVESVSSEGDDCGQCWDCSKNDECPAKLSEEQEKKLKEIKKQMNKEIDKIVQPDINLKNTNDYKKLEEDLKGKQMSDDDKINAFAKFIHDNGGINVNNIIELKQLCILIGATETMEGFKNFPRESCLKMLEMMIYHTNKHLEILNV